MKHFYFFVSSNRDDKLTQISVFTTCKRKAYSIALKYFAKHGYTGVPQILAI